MIERGFGRVLNVASVAGRMTVGGDYSYGPTKAYLIALSKGLASAYKAQGVLGGVDHEVHDGDEDILEEAA